MLAVDICHYVYFFNVSLFAHTVVVVIFPDNSPGTTEDKFGCVCVVPPRPKLPKIVYRLAAFAAHLLGCLTASSVY